jgi:hypothetical protein
MDTLVSDSKANSADTRAEKTLTGGSENAKGSTGFNQDAEAIGGAALDGAENLAEKAKRKMYGY